MMLALVVADAKLKNSVILATLMVLSCFHGDCVFTVNMKHLMRMCYLALIITLHY